MGDQRRSDSDKARRDDQTRDGGDERARREDSDARFDPAHAQLQHAFHKRGAVDVQQTIPIHTVQGAGDVDTQIGRFDAAVAAKNAGDVLAIVREMDTEKRKHFAAPKLDELATFMSPHQIIHVGGLAGAPFDDTLLAALEAKPAMKREEVRAFFADIGPTRMGEGFWNQRLIDKLDALGKPTDVLPQLGNDGALRNVLVLKWVIKSSPPKLVARLLLSIDQFSVPAHVEALDYLGPTGWQWLAAVDAQIAKASDPNTLAAYRDYAKSKVAEPEPDRKIDDAKHAAELEKWTTVAETEQPSPAEVRGDAAWLRAHRAEVTAKSSALDLQLSMQRAGFSPTEQFEWLVDKPGITAQQLREATTLMSTDQITLAGPLLAKLQSRFPKTSVEDVLSGDLPSNLVIQGARTPALAKWLLAGAAPETILRIVASRTDLIDEWCAMLVTTGVGFGWVRELGGFYNDPLLRRFVIKCPDEETRNFVQQRILGEGHFPSKTVAAPVEAPTAYTSARSHLDADLDRQKGKPDASKTIAADVTELAPAEIDALRRDATRLKQVLATATKATFVQILDAVGPELQVALVYATKDNITPANLIAWMQTRPAREVTATLSDPFAVERVRKLVKEFGPFELFPPMATPDVLGAILKKNPAIIEWLVQSEAARVLPVMTMGSAIDASVRALATQDVDTLNDWLPSAAALGPIGKTIYVQMQARAKGDLRSILDTKLSVKLPGKDEEPSDDLVAADDRALVLREPGAFTTRLQKLLDEKAPPSSILTLCRSEPTAYKDVAANPKLQEKLTTLLELSPDVAFGVPLATVLASRDLHAWILQTAPAYKVLNAITPAHDAGIAATLDEDPLSRKKFFDELPRGRGLDAAQKKTLHRVSKLVKNELRVTQMFEIAFDTPVSEFPRADLDKLWSVLEVVPHAHVDQKSISSFKGMTGPAANATPGVYYPETQKIELQTGQIGVKDATLYHQGFHMTEEQAIEVCGSRDEFERFKNAGHLVPAHGGWMFKQETGETFTHTILHEVGHAVDYMLGAKTELIYDLVGWKRFNTADFDGWAKQLGGWDAVTAPDQTAIRQAWISWLQGGGSGTVADLVDSEHPAVAKRYAHVGVVKAATKKYGPFPEALDQQYVMPSYKSQAFFTLSTRGYLASPTGYALTAPEEYFAECYAAYYREYDGTAKTVANKGAAVAPFIKKWFDSHIDTIGANPLRGGRS